MGSLQEALRQAGLTESQKEATSKPRRGRPQRKQTVQNRQSGQQRQSRPKPDELDLAEAYRLRDAAEKQQALQKKHAKKASQEARRQRNLVIEASLKDQRLNDPNAELVRYFEYRGRVCRVLCTENQRQALNEGQLAVIMFKGGPCLITAELAEQLKSIAPDLIPDLGEPKSSQLALGDALGDDDYPPIPDDLVW